MEIRFLTEEEISASLFSGFDRRQEVKKCRRRINGKWQVIDAPFVDDWSDADYIYLAECLKNTVKQGGAVIGVFIGDKLKGFASVEGKPIGSQMQYIDLTSIHVSADCRGMGIGKKLFEVAADHARRLGGKKLYISSHSAVETQEFYKKMGCCEALEYSAYHVKQEPCDCQLEYVL